ncbi:MAG: ABC transporter permease [Phycisphaerales bacterium]|nr:MAG: ABC transporter permease [Phycisphaerales bacterium]
MPMTAVSTRVAMLGGAVYAGLETLGAFTRFAASAAMGVGSVRTWARQGRFRNQLFRVGTLSVPVLMVTGAFIGMVLAIEGYLQFQSVGQETRLGGVINVSVVKQIGPVLAAVILAGRVGCSLTAELGAMRVSEQLDAMRALAADPIKVLVVPRVLACAAMIPILTVVSNICGVFGGWLVCTQFYPTDPAAYWQFSQAFVSWFDITNGLAKSVCFGVAIGLISCWKGFTCEPGAVGVGKATTSSFVTSFMAIIIMNLLLAKLFNELDLIRTGGELDPIFG